METMIEQFKDRLADAVKKKAPLRIIGGNSKAFYGHEVQGELLDMSGYSGIVNYEPTELYITVKAGTLLQEVEQTLAASGQMLAFEPPRFSETSTVGGTVASGLSGPRRPYAGSVRDFILGIKCLNGLGQVMSFGGQVMKNVAGYDLSRLLTGSHGTLGIILEVSLKVLPLPKYEITCRQALSHAEAIQRIRAIANQPLPLSALAYDDGYLYFRLSGTKQNVDEAVDILGLERFSNGQDWWQALRDFQHPFFQTDSNIWRLSLPAMAQADFKSEGFILDWGGAQYWLKSDRSSSELFQQASDMGGSATLFQTMDKMMERFQPLPAEMFKLHKGLKHAFDPHRVLNPGRIYPTL